MSTKYNRNTMRKLILLSTAIASFIMGGSALAESDAQLKTKILGYWMSPRHAYLIQADGLMRMCPTTGPNPATTVNHWDIRNGTFYQDDNAYKIVKFTKTEFDYASTKDIGIRANGKYIVTAPAGTVFRLSRTTRAIAEKY
jgi:hypothetical protein